MAYREKPPLLKMIEEGEAPALDILIRREADIASRPGQMDRLNDIADAVAWLASLHDFEIARVRREALEEEGGRPCFCLLNADSTIPGVGVQVESWGLDKLSSISQAPIESTARVLRERQKTRHE